jgi:steroid 5-alpha reductase family enzyme
MRGHCERRMGTEMKNLSTPTYFGLFILTCILAAMVSIAVMQVVRTVEDVGPRIYIVGGAVAIVGILIPLMMVVMIRHLQKGKE